MSKSYQQNRFIIWAYNNTTESKIFNFWHNRGLISSKDNNIKSFVIPSSSVDSCLTIKKSGKIYLNINDDEYPLSPDSVLFLHGISDVVNLPEIVKSIRVLGYSSVDIPYQQMIEEVQSINSNQDFLNFADKWVTYYSKHFIVDVHRRVKHRALNLFAHINLDIQTLQDLWEKKDFIELQEVCATLNSNWDTSQTKGFNRSPLNEIRRLWFLLVGEVKGEILPKDVLLVKDLRGKSNTFFKWIRNQSFGNDQTFEDKWNELIRLCGLNKNNNHFSINQNACILRFFQILIIIIKEPLIWLDTIIRKALEVHHVQKTYNTTHLSDNEKDKNRFEQIEKWIKTRPLDTLWHILYIAEQQGQDIIKIQSIEDFSDFIDKKINPQTKTKEKQIKLFEDDKLHSFAKWMVDLSNSFDALIEKDDDKVKT